MGAIRVLVADDDTLLREGVASLLEKAGFDVVRRVGTATELLEFVGSDRPDLVVVDIRMPPTHTTEGLEAARKIRAEHPDIGVLVLSAHVEVEYAAELITSGDGVGYLLKSRVGDVTEFADACRRVATGGSAIDPELVRELLLARRKDDPLSALSQRELEVLELMAQGLSNSGIARHLWITESTVEKHVHGVMRRLDLNHAQEYHRRVLAVLAFLTHH
ncbi:MAG: response regulator transcription factor [Mycobacterium sp.]